MTAASPYHVAKADLDRDREAILALWKRHLPNHPYPERRYEWGNRENPFSPGRRWLLSCDNQTVGTTGMVIRRFKIDDRVVLAGRVGGLGVDKDHRCLGPALMLQRAALDEIGRDGLAMLYGSAPPEVAAILRRIGFQSMGELVRYVKVLDVEPYLRHRLGLNALARWIAPPLNMALDAVTRATWRPFHVRPIDGFDARFDALWDRAARHYPITTERTSRFLAWRFDPTVDRAPFITVGVSAAASDRLLGYAVYRMLDGHAHVTDLFAEDAGETLDNVLAAVTRYVHDQGAASITVKCLASGLAGRVLERGGFHQRPEGEIATLVVSPPAAGEPARDPAWASRCYFLGADDFWN